MEREHHDTFFRMASTGWLELGRQDNTHLWATTHLSTLVTTPTVLCECHFVLLSDFGDHMIRFRIAGSGCTHTHSRLHISVRVLPYVPCIAHTKHIKHTIKEWNVIKQNSTVQAQKHSLAFPYQVRIRFTRNLAFYLSLPLCLSIYLSLSLSSCLFLYLSFSSLLRPCPWLGVQIICQHTHSRHFARGCG